jgi:hypothetical protein
MHFVRLNCGSILGRLPRRADVPRRRARLIASGLVATGAWRRVAIAVTIAATLAGAPTALIDTYNAQDITNFSESPIGPWTVTVTPDETQGLEFLRRVTPATAVVQMDPLARERSTWSLIPSFAQRRMAGASDLRLLGGYRERLRVRRALAAGRRMYEPRTQRTRGTSLTRCVSTTVGWTASSAPAYPAGMAKFDGRAYFVTVVSEPEVRILSGPGSQCRPGLRPGSGDLRSPTIRRRNPPQRDSPIAVAPERPGTDEPVASADLLPFVRLRG